LKSITPRSESRWLDWRMQANQALQRPETELTKTKINEWETWSARNWIRSVGVTPDWCSRKEELTDERNRPCCPEIRERLVIVRVPELHSLFPLKRPANFMGGHGKLPPGFSTFGTLPMAKKMQSTRKTYQQNCSICAVELVEPPTYALQFCKLLKMRL
jgi:hypothetical protein